MNILIALSYAFCWGVGLTLTKIALSGISATTLLIIQLLAANVFLYTVCYWKEGKIPLGLSSLKRGIAGIFEPALTYMCGTLGLELTTATNASLISSTEVAMTVLSATLFLGEKLKPVKLILVTVSFSGVFLLIRQDSQAAMHNSVLGDLLVLLGTMFAVGYVVFSKVQIASVSPLELIASQQFVGLILTVLCFGSLSLFSRSHEVNAIGILPQFWLLAIVSGIMQYALAFLLYLITLSKVSLSHSAFYVALVPVFGVASAIILLGEQLSPLQWIGAALVIGSSYFAISSKIA